MLGIRGRLHCRRHINKMFYFPPSAVCVKTAPALPCSCALPPRPPLHRRLPHFSLLLLTFSFAWRYKGCGNKAGLHHRSIKDERSGRRKPESVFSFLVFFSVSVLRALWIVAPRRAGLLECHSEWTQELWGLFPHFEGKLVKKKRKKENSFIRLSLLRAPSFTAFVFFFILKTCRRWFQLRRSEDTWDKRCGILLFHKDSISSKKVQG